MLLRMGEIIARNMLSWLKLLIILLLLHLVGCMYYFLPYSFCTPQEKMIKSLFEAHRVVRCTVTTCYVLHAMYFQTHVLNFPCRHTFGPKNCFCKFLFADDLTLIEHYGDQFVSQVKDRLFNLITTRLTAFFFLTTNSIMQKVITHNGILEEVVHCRFHPYWDSEMRWLSCDWTSIATDTWWLVLAFCPQLSDSLTHLI